MRSSPPVTILRPGPAFGICLAGLVLAVAIVLSDAAPRKSGTNRVKASALSLDVAGGSVLCQAPELVPAGTAKLAVTVTRVEGAPPPLEVRIAAADGSAAGRAGAAGGLLTVPVEPPIAEATDARVCVRNGGASLVSLGSGPVSGERAATVDGAVQAGRIRIEYLRDGSESWWALLPTILHRFGIGRGSVIGSWALWAAGILLLLAIGLGARLLTREDRVA